MLAAVLVGVVLGLPPAASLALIALVVLAGAWEWSALLAPRGALARLGYVLLVGAGLALGWRATRDPAALRLLLVAAAAWWIAALAWLALAPQRVQPWSAALAGLLALVPAGIALAELRLAPGFGAALLELLVDHEAVEEVYADEAELADAARAARPR